MTCEIRAVLDKIESEKFDIELNVTSNFSIYRNAITTSEYFEELRELLKNSDTKEFVEYLYNKISIEIDMRYLNPYDTAIAFYILMLDSIDSEIAQRISKYLISLSKNWKWSYKMAKHVLVEKTASCDSNSISDQLDCDDRYPLSFNSESESENLVMNVLLTNWSCLKSGTNSIESEIQEILSALDNNKIATVSDSTILDLAA